MAFNDLNEPLSVEPLVLPIGGKLYSFPGEISGTSWLLLQRLGGQSRRAAKALAKGEEQDLDKEVLSDIEQDLLMEELFGGLEDEMAADGLSSRYIQAVFSTLVVFHMNGRAVAEAVWNRLGESTAPNRAARRHPPKNATVRGSHASSTTPSSEDLPGETS